MRTARTSHGVVLRFALLLGGLQLFAAAQAEEPSPDLMWVYEYMLANAHTERELAPVTDRITFQELPNTTLADFAAQVLLTSLEDTNYPGDSQVRLLNLLIETKSDRYTGVFVRVRQEAKDQTARRIAREAGKTPPRYHQNPFMAGSVDIRTILAEMDAAALAAKPTAEQAQRLADFRGGSIAQLLAWAGRPQQIVSNQVNINNGLNTVKMLQIGFLYRGIGRVLFRNPPTQPFLQDWHFKSFDADPLAFEQDFPYRAHAAESGLPDDATLEMIQLTNGSTLAKRRAVEINYRRPAPPVEFMDTAAEILASGFGTVQDDVSIDMYSWICRLLSGHGGQRYAGILARVAAETTDSKLKRYASLPIEAGSAAPPEPYVPGSSSLDTQRAKYPSPYSPAARASTAQ